MTQTARRPLRRILVVNPNTNPDTTAMLARRMRAALDKAGGAPVDITAVTVAAGPTMITTGEALAAAATHVVDAVVAAFSGAVGGVMPDAVVVGAFGDPGVELLRAHPALDGVQVTGIGEASLLAATVGGGRFAIATTTGDLAEALAALVDRVGVSDLYTGLELTETDPLVLAGSPRESRRELAAAVERARAHGARRVVIGGGPLSDVAADLEQTYPGAIVEPVAAAAMLVLGHPSA
ncbi:aspartate/glutamate racemase family protein [Corynebacterium sp.]|uniref:aspartate/glutamate racemase family protein n=1 Tax=Corynebacterium sp. TaxID=1720 RepID=UPI003B3BC1A0